jgi:hypothetical protein
VAQISHQEFTRKTRISNVFLVWFLVVLAGNQDFSGIHVAVKSSDTYQEKVYEKLKDFDIHDSKLKIFLKNWWHYFSKGEYLFNTNSLLNFINIIMYNLVSDMIHEILDLDHHWRQFDILFNNILVSSHDSHETSNLVLSLKTI